MVGKRKSNSKRNRSQLMGNHQRCWIWGRNLVHATFHAEKWPIQELLLSNQLTEAELETFKQQANDRHLKFQLASSNRLTQLCGVKDHQGYLAKMPPFPYDSGNGYFDNFSRNTCFLMLDSIQDPFNFGAMLRSAEVLGVDAVIVGQAGQVKVNSLVARSSAGAINTIPLIEVSSLEECALQIKNNGMELVAASEKAAEPIYNCLFNKPVLVMLGNEGQGIRQSLLQLCDRKIAIPQAGQISSLNASVATGIIIYEIIRQRQLN